MKILILFCFLFGFVLVHKSLGQLIEIELNNSPKFEINSNLFGHFLEKASWGNEIGGDLLIDSKSKSISKESYKILEDLHIPLIRFPGGTDVDYYEWFTLIDHVPGKWEIRPTYSGRIAPEYVTDNRMGLDEFLNLCKRLRSEPLLVVNLGDAFFKKESIEKSAQEAAGMVAYCNASTEQETGLEINWALVREKNGQKNPYKVKYFEIGNEPWLYNQDITMSNSKQEAIAHYLKCAEAIIDAMRKIDPDIQIIIDGGVGGMNSSLKTVSGDKIQYVAYHPYMPWEIKYVIKNDTIDPTILSQEDIWKAWVAIPAMDSLTGTSSIENDSYYKYVRSAAYPIAVTEWNWNGWWGGGLSKKVALNSKFAQGIGAAGYLHSFIRQGNHIQIGCQSMLVGKSWGITSIRFSGESFDKPTLYPTGAITGFYSKYHGKKYYEVKAAGIPFYKQEYQMGSIKKIDRVAYLDAVCTGSDSLLFLHLINRSWDQSMPVHCKLNGFGSIKQIVAHKFEDEKDYAKISHEKLSVEGTELIYHLPQKSVTILEIKLK